VTVLRSPTSTRVLLLVEDNPGDALLVSEMLEQLEPENYQIIHVPRISEAVDVLRSTDVDVVLLDLRLPDCTGIDTVKTVRESAGQIPIVVLTGTDDEQLALTCIHAGAQDYLAKGEIRLQSLKRAIGYAITRIREAQVRELQKSLERYRALSSSTQGTSVTAALVGSGAIRERHSSTFDSIVRDYRALLAPYLGGGLVGAHTPRAEMERVVTDLGDLGGGPRDLLDVHLAALDRVGEDDKRSRARLVEARLFALEMMGLLVDYYRVGHRRRSGG
jgi:CheY-like chemotaxis protein